MFWLNTEAVWTNLVKTIANWKQQMATKLLTCVLNFVHFQGRYTWKEFPVVSFPKGKLTVCLYLMGKNKGKGGTKKGIWLYASSKLTAVFIWKTEFCHFHKFRSTYRNQSHHQTNKDLEFHNHSTVLRRGGGEESFIFLQYSKLTWLLQPRMNK